MTNLTIDEKTYIDLPVWVCHRAFHGSDASHYRLKKMLDRGFVEFNTNAYGGGFDGPVQWEYTITFDTEENMTKFIMEFL